MGLGIWRRQRSLVTTNSWRFLGTKCVQCDGLGRILHKVPTIMGAETMEYRCSFCGGNGNTAWEIVGDDGRSYGYIEIQYPWGINTDNPDNPVSYEVVGPHGEVALADELDEAFRALEDNIGLEDGTLDIMSSWTRADGLWKWEPEKA